MSSLKSFIIECGYLNVFVAVGPVPVRIALLPPSLSCSLAPSFSLSARENRKRGIFFPLPSVLFSGSFSHCPFHIGRLIREDHEENATLGVPFEITRLFCWIQSGSGWGWGGQISELSGP